MRKCLPLPPTAICMLVGWRGWRVAESTTLACTTRTTMSSPARLTWVPLFDSRSDRCSRPRPRARAVALLSPFSVRASVGDLSTPRPSEVERPTRRSVCSCARVKRRYQACWLWCCQVSYNCICAVALRETGLLCHSFDGCSVWAIAPIAGMSKNNLIRLSSALYLFAKIDAFLLDTSYPNPIKAHEVLVVTPDLEWGQWLSRTERSRNECASSAISVRSHVLMLMYISCRWITLPMMTFASVHYCQSCCMSRGLTD